FVGLELFRLLHWSLPFYKKPPHIQLDVAGISSPAALDIACGSQSEAKIGFVGPVDFVMPTALPRFGVVGYFVLFVSRHAKSFDCLGIHAGFKLFAHRLDQTLLSLFPEWGPFLVCQTVCGNMVRSQLNGRSQVIAPLCSRLTRHSKDKIQG